MKTIIIVANGWNAGWLGCYGNEWVRTHSLDRLAAESVLFDQHFAVSPAPSGWFAAIDSGRYAGKSSLLAALRNYGCRNVRVHDLKYAASASDSTDWSESIALPKRQSETPGEAIYLQIDQTLQSLSEIDNWLLWIETDRFVPPWDVSLDFFDEYAQDMAFLEEGEEPQPWDEPPTGPHDCNDRNFERLQTTFASVVTEWDAELAEWFELFREHKLDESALWLVTSGYGLSLGEHGWIGPSGRRPFEELGHLPLLMRLPSAEQGGRRVESLTSSLDLLPTVIDFFGRPIPEDTHGKSLLPLARGQRNPIHPCLCQSIRVDGHDATALRTPDWACYYSIQAQPLLFRKPEDRWEVNDLRQKHLEWTEYLESLLRAYCDRPDAIEPLRSYDEIMTQQTEENREHRSSGQRDDGPSQSQSRLRGHQGDEED